MSNKTYAVTGVASGIGAQLARVLKEAGHSVVGFDINTTTANIDQFIKLDLNDHSSITAAAAQIAVPLDGLCNNAGLPPREGLEAAILQVNFLGTRAFTEAVLPHIREAGSIVNMASRAGHGWRDGLEQVKRLAVLTDKDQITDFVIAENIDPTRCYNLSKEAVILWSVAESERMLRKGLRINSVSPGGIATEILDDFQRVFGDAMAHNIERAGRAGAPEEVAEVAAFLLSPASNWIKGTDIAIDGGMGAFNMSDAMQLDALQL